jgi:hypothetical protein
MTMDGFRISQEIRDCQILLLLTVVRNLVVQESNGYLVSVLAKFVGRKPLTSLGGGAFGVWSWYIRR